VRGNLSFACPLEQRARLYLQVLGSLICGKPFGFHVNLFPDASRTLNRLLSTKPRPAVPPRRTSIHFTRTFTFQCRSTFIPHPRLHIEIPARGTPAVLRTCTHFARKLSFLARFRRPDDWPRNRSPARVVNVPLEIPTARGVHFHFIAVKNTHALPPIQAAGALHFAPIFKVFRVKIRGRVQIDAVPRAERPNKACAFDSVHERFNGFRQVREIRAFCDVLQDLTCGSVPSDTHPYTSAFSAYNSGNVLTIAHDLRGG